MRIYIERRKNSVLCNECLAFKGNPEKDIGFVYVIRVGNNTMSFCEECFLNLSRNIYTAYAFEEDISTEDKNEREV